MDSLKDLNLVTAAMAGQGFRLVTSRVDPMDSGAVEYTDGLRSVVVWKDRSQWFVGGERDVLEPLDCWRAYDDISEFCDALLGFVCTR